MIVLEVYVLPGWYLSGPQVTAVRHRQPRSALKFFLSIILITLAMFEADARAGVRLLEALCVLLCLSDVFQQSTTVLIVHSSNNDIHGQVCAFL